MKKNLRQISCLLLCASLFAACEKKSLYKGGEEGGSGTASTFDFSTEQSVTVNVNYNVPIGAIIEFEAFTENPMYVDDNGSYLKKDNVQPFIIGHTDKNGAFSMDVVLPAFASEVYVYTPMIGVSTLMSGKISNGTVTVETAAAVKSKGLATRAQKKYWTNWKEQTLSWKTINEWDANGKLTSATKQKDIDGEILNIINETLSEKHKTWIVENQLAYVTIPKESVVNLYSVWNKSDNRNNVLAYYTFKDGEMDIPSLAPGNEEANAKAVEKFMKDVNENRLVIAYPNLGDGGGLKSGDGIQLKYWDGEKFVENFPAGTKIGFVLLADAWKNNTIAKTTNAVYSERNFNSYNMGGTVLGQRIHTATFKANDNVVLAFEDLPWNENDTNNSGDFKDNVFVVDVNDPAFPDGFDPEDPDANAVMNNGVLAFEDEWPFKGDYDMNDVVISYSSKTFQPANNQFLRSEEKFVLENNGAEYHNAFGFTIPLVMNSSIESIEVVSSYTCDGQGWSNKDKASENPQVMLFDDLQKVAKGTEFVVKIKYKGENGVMGNNQMFAPHNPYIVIRQKDTDPDYLSDNRREVHLVGYKPTPKADMSLFHTGDDLSVPANNLYYVSDANYPFAINLAGVNSFKLPSEKQNIGKKYSQFDMWYSTNGAEYKDWYLHPNE